MTTEILYLVWLIPIVLGETRSLTESQSQSLPIILRRSISKKKPYYRPLKPIMLPNELHQQLMQHELLPEIKSQGRSRTDCFAPGSIVPEFKAEIHQVLKDRVVSNDEISFRYIQHNDMLQLRDLHYELFPLNYTEFLDMVEEDLLNRSGLFVGIVATIPTRKSNNSTELSTPSDYIIGLIIWKKITSKRYRNKVDRFLIKRGVPISDVPVDNDHMVMVITFGIIDEFCNKGIGKQLLAHNVKYLQKYSPETKVILVSVITWNVRGIKFYQRQGFEIIKFIPKYYKRSIQGDGIVMAYYMDDSEANKKLFKSVKNRKLLDTL